MDAENLSTIENGTGSTLARKSWTAYVGTAGLAFVLLLMVTPGAWRASTGAGVVALVLSLGFLTYRVMMIRSFHLFYDGTGVWLSKGVFPWQKGVAGVKWRDIDEAVFFQGLWSWMFKSYTVRVGHRFTKSSELMMSHMARGHEAASTVNTLHQGMLSQGQLN